MNRNIPSRQKLGIIEENKMSENWSYQKNVKDKRCSHKLPFSNENQSQKDSDDS